MARWRLMEPHYLRVVGTDWEYKEVDRKTGRERRMRIDVPRLMNPADPNDWTNRWGNRDNEEGEIVVCHGPSDGAEVQFFGDPTPGMVPLDDEATAISAGFNERWRYKPEEASTGFSQSLVDRFQSEMAEVKAKPAEVPGMAELVASIGKLVEVVAPARRA